MELAETHDSYDDELCHRNWCFDDVSLSNFFADWSLNFVVSWVLVKILKC